MLVMKSPTQASSLGVGEGEGEGEGDFVRTRVNKIPFQQV